MTALAADRPPVALATARGPRSLNLVSSLGLVGLRPEASLGMATSYHQLGCVTQERGDLTAAESWYRKSLKIRAGLADWSGTAESYHNLGMVAQERGELPGAP